MGVTDQMTDGPSERELKTPAAPSLVRRLLAIPEVGILIPLVVLVLVFYACRPTFLARDNIVAILRFMSFVGIIAVGQTLLIIAGEIDISVGSVAGLGAIAAAHLMATAGWPVAAAIGAALLACALVGALNGFLITRLGVPAFIATIGMLYMARGVKHLICGGFPIYPLPPWIGRVGPMEPLGTNWAFVVFIALVLVGDLVLRRTVYGRALYATGGNIEVARLAGINTFWIKMSAFITCSILAGLAGILLMAQLKSGDTTIGEGWELNVIAGVVVGGVSLLGGAGSMLGTLIGVTILFVVANGLVVINLNPHWQTVAIGLVMILAVMVDMARRTGKLDVRRWLALAARASWLKGAKPPVKEKGP